MNGNFPPALVLNANYKPLQYLPLSVMPWCETIHNLVAGDISVVKEYDIDIRSQHLTMRLPSVVVCNSYVHRSHLPGPSRYNVIALRDRYTCAYCGKRYGMTNLTKDHVIPRAHGGPDRWENVVAACAECNQFKADRTPQQAGMSLLWRPRRPTVEELARNEFFDSKRRLHDQWREFVPFVEQ